MLNANNLVITVTAAFLLVPSASHASNAQIWWSKAKEPGMIERPQRELPRRTADQDAESYRYIAEVQAVIQRRWREPVNSRPNEESFVLVMINPENGEIREFTVQGCSASPEFCDSVTETMNRLKYLPRPPNPNMVRGGVRIRFAPDHTAPRP